MAVAMLIGNVPKINLSLFGMGYSIPSVIAVELGGVDRELHKSVLIELGLVLFLVTVVVNTLAQLLIGRLGKQAGRPLCGGGCRPRPTPVFSGAASAAAPPVCGPTPARAKFINSAMTVVLALCLVLILIPLFHIFIYVVVRGARSLDWTFFTNLPGDTPSGLGHSLIGSLLMVSLATVGAVPLGILAALYLSEYRTSSAGAGVRFVGELLGGVPSVVIGIFAYALLVGPFGFSAYAGAFALGVMMLPIVMRASEEALRLVPSTLRNASYALGARHWQTVVRVIVPAALPAILTGVFLAIARIAGERRRCCLPLTTPTSGPSRLPNGPPI